MTASKQMLGYNWTGLVILAGIAFAGVGGYFHVTISAQVSAGQCDACAPWHPLFVLTPLALGFLFALLGGYLWYRN